MKEFKSFYKTVGGGEGDKRSYHTRIDTYGCGNRISGEQGGVRE